MRPASRPNTRLARRTIFRRSRPAYGPAEIDKAVLDALLRAAGLNFFDGMTANVAGIDASMTPDLSDNDITSFLASRRSGWSASRCATRSGSTTRSKARAASPTLSENSGARYFKLKLGGNPERDAARLAAIGKALARLPHDYKVTLRRQRAICRSRRAARPDRATGPRRCAAADRRKTALYRAADAARHHAADAARRGSPARDFIIDEADNSYDAFPAARALGYRGISSKSCKGLYKSIINAARAAKWSADGERFFVTGEDLTCQAGLAVQQDLALGALIGVTHAERNGHHYVDGFAETPAAEAQAFRSAHPDLYARCRQGSGSPFTTAIS